jgi:hypothetical protein
VPLTTHTDPPEEKGVKEGRRRSGAAVGEPFAAKTGAARERSRTRRRQERLLPLLPLLPRRRAAACIFFLLAGKPHRHTTPMHYTSARSHGGEDDRCSPLVDATAIEPEWNAPRRRIVAGDADHRARLG